LHFQSVLKSFRLLPALNPVIPVIQMLPLTMLTDSLRSIMTEGTNLLENLQAIILLTFMGAVFFILGIRVYKWY
jgi:ABC-type polysaccharide/polyol phosphate export permease